MPCTLPHGFEGEIKNDISLFCDQMAVKAGMYGLLALTCAGQDSLVTNSSKQELQQFFTQTVTRMYERKGKALTGYDNYCYPVGLKMDHKVITMTASSTIKSEKGSRYDYRGQSSTEWKIGVVPNILNNVWSQVLFDQYRLLSQNQPSFTSYLKKYGAVEPSFNKGRIMTKYGGPREFGLGEGINLKAHSVDIRCNYFTYGSWYNINTGNESKIENKYFHVHDKVLCDYFDMENGELAVNQIAAARALYGETHTGWKIDEGWFFQSGCLSRSPARGNEDIQEYSVPFDVLELTQVRSRNGEEDPDDPFFAFGAPSLVEGISDWIGPVYEDTTKDLSDVVLESDSFIYNGEAIEPSVTVYSENEIVPPSGYTVSYEDNKEAGFGFVTIEGTGDYSGILTTVFRILSKGTQTIEADDLTVTYGDTDACVFAMSDGGGTITYSVKKGSEDYIDVNTISGVLTIKAVPEDGKAYVIVKAAETSFCPQAEKEVTVTINKANAAAAMVSANNRIYDGAEKPLVAVTGKAAGGTMQYALGTDALNAPEDKLYTESIPVKTDAGTYYVWYKVVGDDNHNDTEPGCIVATVYDSNTLIYNGEEQELVKPGTAEGGIMEYVLGTDDATAPEEGWSDKVPTAKEPGEYFVWYKVVGDENHNDKEPECVKATIVPDSQVEQFKELISILPDDVTLENNVLVETLRALYDGLTETQKKLIPEEAVVKLEKAEAKIKALKEVERFTEAVKAVYGNKAGEGKGLVDKATDIFGSLTDEQKTFIPDETVILYAVAVYAFEKDRTFRSGDAYYRGLSNGDVTYLKPASRDTEGALVPNQVKKGDFLFKVIKVSNNAFRNCENLKWAVIGKNVNVLGKNIFAGDENLTKVRVLGKGLKSGKVTDAFVGAGKDGSLTVKVPTDKLYEYSELLFNEGGLNGQVETD